MPSSSPLEFYSVKLVKYEPPLDKEPPEENQPAILLLEIPNVEKNRVSLQNLANQQVLAMESPVAVTLRVPDPYAKPAPAE